MKKHVVYLLALSVILMNACQKEKSFETGKNLSDGSLQSNTTGDCLPKIINGAYIVDTTLVPATNTVTVDVNVIKTGSYVISSDTVNGYYFKAVGVFSTTGINSVKLRGNGTPLAAGTNNFIISYDSSFCDISITVLPAGAGTPATFTFGGTSGNCTSTVNGTYALNTPLATTNTVNISVNVTVIGTYTISTTSTAGMTFSATGAFATTGVQTVTLAGAGTPTIGGSNTIAVTAGTSSCNFAINVLGASLGTLGSTSGACTPSVINGTYSVGSVLTSSNTAQVQVSVTTIGGYSITTNSVAGFSFNGSGVFIAPGVQTVILNGNGTPTATGPQTFTVTFGTSSCTFVVNVGNSSVSDYYPRTTNSNWSYEFDDVATDSLLIKVDPNTVTVSGNVLKVFMGTPDATMGFDTSGYYRKAGNDYFHYTNLADYLSFDNDQWVEFNFIKDNQAAGFSWTTPGYSGTIQSTPVTIRIKFTVLQKDVPISLTTSAGTTSYPNTIVIEEKYEALSGANWIPLDNVFGYFKDYYSRNIGWIKEEYFDTSGAPANQFELRRYVIF